MPSPSHSSFLVTGMISREFKLIVFNYMQQYAFNVTAVGFVIGQARLKTKTHASTNVAF
jgi:hypothetical protein